MTWDRFAGALREQRHDFLLAVGEADVIGAAAKLLAHHGEGVGTEDHLVDLGCLSRLVAAQDVADAQHQFARLEGF
ncbi:hypothetical protein D3C72_1858220 [compost metagenome]